MFIQCSLNALPLSSHRLIKGGSTPYSQNFTFVNTSYTDDKTIFTCVGNKLDESEDTEMGVLCKRTHIDTICNLHNLYTCNY